MASYAEDILCVAHEASGPSLRDLETIRSFQSCSDTKDVVSVLYNLLIPFFINPCFSFLEWDAHLFGSQSY
jgi:hypothetical protein